MGNRSENGIGKSQQIDECLEHAEPNWTRSTHSIRARDVLKSLYEAGHTSAPDHMPLPK